MLSCLSRPPTCRAHTMAPTCRIISLVIEVAAGAKSRNSKRVGAIRLKHAVTKNERLDFFQRRRAQGRRYIRQERRRRHGRRRQEEEEDAEQMEKQDG